MVFSCQFNNEPYNEIGFDPELSDMGMCYTFNMDSNHALVTRTPGLFVCTAAFCI